MPKPVPSVPNPWLPYMDGRIWEFTEDEFKEMPGAIVMTSAETHGPIGTLRMTWYVGNKYYVRFFRQSDCNTEDYPERLAGWI